MTETTSLMEYGLAGVLMFMTFQYVVKPLISTVVAKIKGTNGHNPSPEVHAMLKILGKRDSKDRYLIHGYCQKEAIEKLTEAVEELTAKLE